MRGRFLSRAIDSVTYRRNVVRYIDHNPVKAGLASYAWDYPWCSAAHFVRDRGPAWLERSWTEAWVTEVLGAARYFPGGYRSVVGQRPAKGSMIVIEERLRAGQFARCELDSLVSSAPLEVQRWMERKAKLADGTKPGEPVCDADSIRLAVKEAEEATGTWNIAPNSRRLDGWTVAETGLLRELAGLSMERIAQATNTTSSGVRRRLEIHRRLTGEREYGQRMGELAAAALETCCGVAGRS